ncbi:MAG: patatin-like phospholipase family protein [Gammaproteobacteria bacterium]|nr:patatin-like phospholipase family protein [Gammaproteobacteria bacterium]MDH3430975.1 patatin-like phospholipase family protein [Gammaproteobacteria bacterium]MDH3433283.1 patatin-like phospholipase family protein [Gammaproteobacteria bacterium]
MPTPKIGLALGSGASRGWSHIGVIKALLAAGIEPDVICGTSVGAMIGGSYLAGNMQSLEDWVLSSTRTDVLRFFDVKLSQSGFVDTKRLSWFLHSYVATEQLRIEDLPKKYAAVSTNLETGREVWFTEGGLADAIRASMAMPGLFPAVRVDTRWLVDGGLVNPVPVSVCHALGADLVIAVNLNSGIVRKRNEETRDPVREESNSVLGNFKQQAREYSNSVFPNRGKKNEAPGLFHAIANSINIFQDRITRSRLAGDPADVLLSPRLAHIGMLEFHRADEAIEEGERCVHEALTEIHRVVGK